MRNYKIILIVLTGLIGLSVLLVLNLSEHSVPAIKKVKPADPVSKPVQKQILTITGIDSVLNTLEIVPFEKLGQAYLNFSWYDKPSFKSDMGGRIFYIVNETDMSKNLVGKFKVADFMPKDHRLRELYASEISATRYLCIDKDVLHRLLDLIIALDQNGYDKEVFIKGGIINKNFFYVQFAGSFWQLLW